MVDNILPTNKGIGTRNNIGYYQDDDDTSKNDSICRMENKENIITLQSLNNWNEQEEDKEYNRYVVATLKGIEPTTIRKILYFEEENIYIVYINETIREAVLKLQMRLQRKNS